MVTATHYREEAKKCREQAAASPGSEAAKHWLRFAADYDVLANLLEDGDDTQPPALPAPTQQQPKSKDKE
jgi:hypothetical protein